MDSLVRDTYVGLKKVARPAWNYAGRYVVPRAINVVGGVAVGVPFAGFSVGKTLGEHSLKSGLWVGKNAGEMGVKSAWWLTKLGMHGVEHGLKFGWLAGKRLPHWALASGYNAIDNRMPAGYGFGNVAVPNLRYPWGTTGNAADRLPFMNLR